MTRTKSAIIVFLVLATAFATALSFDYTDTYVAARFHKALAAELYQPGQPFSLDAFVEHYDWDTVAVIVPGTEALPLTNKFGLTYTPKAGDDVWCLIFIKSGTVVAEIAIEQATLNPPSEIPPAPINRWAAIASIIHTDQGKQMIFVGH